MLTLQMKWLDSLELKFGRYAIPGLIRYIVAMNAMVFILHLLNRHFLSLLYLDPALVMRGQLWRLVTYIFIPALGNWWVMPDYLWLAFWLMFLWMLGDGLEQAWGAFKLNLFYLVGMIGTTIAALVFGSSYNNILLNLSLLFAFATLYPDFTIMAFLVLPMKIKWVAWFSFASLLLAFLTGSLSTKIAILVSMGNYFLFFGPDIVRLARHRHAVSTRRQRYESSQLSETESLHQCVVCHKTEITNPELDFRVAKDDNEYCIEHLPARTAPEA